MRSVSRTESVALRCKSTYEVLRTSVYLERKLTASGLWGSGNVSLVSMQRQTPRPGSIEILCTSTHKVLRLSKFPQPPTQASSYSVLGARHRGKSHERKNGSGAQGRIAALEILIATHIGYEFDSVTGGVGGLGRGEGERAVGRR